MSTFTLEDLAARVKERAQASPDVSYTRKLLDRGIAHCAKKLGEEAVETAIAAVQRDAGAVVKESGDLLYHLLVVWAELGIAPEQVWHELQSREGVSGIAEKASRKEKKD
jgi:phosphoribosyl-ATP pyrophosphohydrolase